VVGTAVAADSVAVVLAAVANNKKIHRGASGFPWFNIRPVKCCNLQVVPGRRWAFPSAQTFLTSVESLAGRAVCPARKVFHGLISLLIPEDCRVCGLHLEHVSRIPVCPKCLTQAAKPIEAEFLCSRCRSPFLNAESLNEQGMCPACEVEPQGFDSVWSYGAYDGVLRRLIHVYKYERVQTLAEPLARLLSDALPRDEEEFDFIAPMPLHWLKKWDRGFNQAELLAKAVAQRAGIPYRDLLKRGKASPAP
jgi:predicted amidophosphoribosyltransferase